MRICILKAKLPCIALPNISTYPVREAFVESFYNRACENTTDQNHQREVSNGFLLTKKQQTTRLDLLLKQHTHTWKMNQKKTKENYSPFQNEVYLLSTLENMTGSD